MPLGEYLALVRAARFPAVSYHTPAVRRCMSTLVPSLWASNF